MFNINNLEENEKKVTGLVESLSRLVKNVKTNSKVRRIIIAAAFVLTFLNKLFLDFVIELAHFDFSFPPFYNVVFWFLFISLIIWAVLIRVKETEVYKPPVDNSIIKGVFSFEERDKEIFKLLQRHREISDYRNAISQSSFQIGVIIGESGCGKTSFLKAGLLPALETAGYKVAVVTLTNESVLKSIYDGLKGKIELPNINESLSISQFLKTVKECIQPLQLVLIIDQLEQFFTQNKTEDSRKFLMAELKEIYANLKEIKILLSIRADFFADLFNILNKLDGFSLTNNYFCLKKFTPEQTVAIFKAISEKENVENIDENFLLKVIKQDLVSTTDALVSPVDIQIVLLSIRNSSVIKLDFTSNSFEKMGGVSGMLERYLQEQISVPNEFNKNNDILSTVMSLIDTKQKTRKGRFTIEEIKNKNLIINPANLENILAYLVYKRIVYEIAADGIRKFEIGHEKLIEPVLALYDKANIGLQKANYILEKRVNEYLGNNRSRRFLLTISEYRLINKYKKSIIWGDTENIKRDLLKSSFKRFRNYGLGICFVLFFAALWLSITRTEWYLFNYKIKNEISASVKGKSISNGQKMTILDSLLPLDHQFAFDLSKHLDNQLLNDFYVNYINYRIKNDSILDRKNLLNIAKSFSYEGQYFDALQKIAVRISDTNLNAAVKLVDTLPQYMLSRFVSGISKKYPEDAISLANSISNSQIKFQAIINIADSISDTKLQKSFELAGTIPDSVLSKGYLLSRLIPKISRKDFPKAIFLANKIPDTINRRIALNNIIDTLIEINPEKAIEIINETTYSTQDNYYKYVQLGKIVEKLVPVNLKLASEITNKIPRIDYTWETCYSRILIQLAKSYPDSAIKMAEKEHGYSNNYDHYCQDISILIANYNLSKAMEVYNKIENPTTKFFTLINISKKYKNIGQEKQIIDEEFTKLNKIVLYDFHAVDMADSLATFNIDAAINFVNTNMRENQQIEAIPKIALTIADSYPAKARQILESIDYTKINNIIDIDFLTIAKVYIILHDFKKSNEILDKIDNIGNDKILAKIALWKSWKEYHLRGITNITFFNEVSINRRIR